MGNTNPTIFQPVNPDVRDERQHRRVLSERVNQLADGKHNATGTVTLDANAASTTLMDPRIGLNTVVLPTPTTAHAAAEVGAGTLWQTFPNAVKGEAQLNHANNAQPDRTFAYSLAG